MSREAGGTAGANVGQNEVGVAGGTGERSSGPAGPTGGVASCRGKGDKTEVMAPGSLPKLQGAGITQHHVKDPGTLLVLPWASRFLPLWEIHPSRLQPQRKSLEAFSVSGPALTFTSAPLCVVSRGAMGNTVVTQQQVVGILAPQADAPSVLEIGCTVLAQGVAVCRGQRAE